MQSKLSLLTTAAALALGLTATASLAEEPTGNAPGAKSDITIVTNDTGKAQGGAAIDENGDSPGAVNSQGLNDPASPSGGAGSMQGGAQSSDQGATGAQQSAQGQGAKSKSSTY